MRLLIQAVVAVVFLVGTCRLVAAQASGGGDCPTVTLSCPDPSTDKPLTYKVIIIGGSRWVTPTYTWSASAGKITGGEGTSEVTIDPEGRDSLTVTVEVGGYPASCGAAASCSWIVCRIGPRKLDEYGDIHIADEQARLDAFAVELKNDPTAQGYVLAYAGRRARSGEAQKRGDRAKSYLLKAHGVEEDRVVVVDGGHREERAVELFIVPSGAVPPTVSPTVDPKDVEAVGRQARRRSKPIQP
jgi:hypothetical protein